MNINRIAACVLSIAMVYNVIPPNAYGATVESNVSVNQTISLESATKLAIDNSMSLRQIRSAKDKAMDGYSKAENGGSQARAMLDMYNSYQKLSDKGAKDALEKAALGQFQAIFGNEPSLGFEQMYDQFIVPSEVTPYQVYVQFQGLKIDDPIVVSTIEYQTKQLYYGILSYQHSINLIADSLKIGKDKLAEMELKYKVGQLAKVTLEAEKLNYEKSKLNYEKQKKELKILEAQFNLLIGRPFSSEVKLQDPGLLKASKDYNYNGLLSAAMSNRGDLKKKQFEIEAIDHEIKVMSQYLRDDKLDRRVDAEQRRMTIKLEKEVLENTIKQEVLTAFSNYRLASEQLNVDMKKTKESEKQLVKMKQLYKVGYVKKLDVYTVELQLQNSKISYESSVYNFNKALDALSRVSLHSVN